MDIIDRLHQKLEKMDLSPIESHNVKVFISQALNAGLACNMPVDPLEGYSNLTAAIKAGEPIEWEELDGLKVQCVNHDVGTNRGKLVRNETYTSERSAGWFYKSMDKAYVYSLIDAWYGKDGWTLWVEGAVPLLRKTADQLKPGTEFYGVLKNSEPDGVAPELMLRTQGHALHLDDYTISQMSPRHFEVVKVVGQYGTFQKPEGK